jgi:GNAT superfamily N-acetyltransferase
MLEIKVRQARPADRETVLAFCTYTWEWGDYIEHVWNKWLDDAAGLLLVATNEDQPVGLVHIQMLSTNEAWLEGLRVDPTYRQQGIGRQLNFEASAEAIRRGATLIRLITESTNTGSIHLVEQIHFRCVGTFVPYTATALTSIPAHNTGLDELSSATLADMDDIIAYLNSSSIFPATGGIYYTNFTGYSISDQLLAAKITAGQVYLLRRWERLDGLAIAEARTSQQSKHLSVGYIDGTTESISLIAYTLRRKLAEFGLESVRVNVPDLMMVRDAFTGAEYEGDKSTFYTYERSLV